MAIFTKESLETLRQRLDLVEVLSSYMELKRSGATFKGLCPFHDEKSPSFVVQRGDSHYHCFGCGAHGDAIQFLMTHQKMAFGDAVEMLAQKFQVHLDTLEEKEESRGPSKILLKEALLYASQFYHFCLLHTEEGHEALRYLYERGIDLDFIRYFLIGLSPKKGGVFQAAMHAKSFSNEVLIEAGLIAHSNDSRFRDFFSDRIMFPIHHPTGDIIGFSGRKYKEETFGGKYINTAETPLFKKSRVLFGLNYSRRRIAKERKAIIVEGQIDTLRLIQVGFNCTVAGQGTAFGEGHVKELLQLGLNEVYLAFDADKAGNEATMKVGHLFQKEGIDVKIIELPQGEDPDSFLMKRGPEAFTARLDCAIDYLSFLIRYLSSSLNINSPAGKNELIKQAVKLIREWNHPVMVHETLKKLAHALKVPEEYVGGGQEAAPNIYIKRSAAVGMAIIDPDRILETDLLRWILLMGHEQPKLIELVKANLTVEDFRVSICQKLFALYQKQYDKQQPVDLLSLVIELDDPQAQMVVNELTEKKVNKDRAEKQLTETLQKILERNWMEKREGINLQIRTGTHSDEETLKLVKMFDDLQKNPPKLTLSS